MQLLNRGEAGVGCSAGSFLILRLGFVLLSVSIDGPINRYPIGFGLAEIFTANVPHSICR